MKNFITFCSLIIVALAITACKDGKHRNDEVDKQTIEAALRTGQAQAISEIIARAKNAPCQPVNLFNHLDENNKVEVNLINVECEALELPEIQAPVETPVEVDPIASPATEAEVEETTQ